jgi:hypothetical protein
MFRKTRLMGAHGRQMRYDKLIINGRLLKLKKGGGLSRENEIDIFAYVCFRTDTLRPVRVL